MKDSFVSPLVLIVVLLAGVAIGFALGHRHGPADVDGLADSRGAASAQEDSLRAHLALLDDLSGHEASDASRQIHAEDRALLLIRLADLAERNGSSAESTRLTSDALAVCASSGLPYCTSFELRQRAKISNASREAMKQSE